MLEIDENEENKMPVEEEIVKFEKEMLEIVEDE